MYRVLSNVGVLYFVSIYLCVRPLSRVFGV